VVGPGGLLTTAGDWLIWNEALAKSALRPGLTDSLTRRMRLTSGREITYALGVVVSDYRGVPEVAHSGSTGGYSTNLARYPDRGNLSIAVLCNSAQGAAVAYTRQLADRLIQDFPRVARLDTSRVDSAAFTRFEGVYRSERLHSPLEVGVGSGARFRALPDGSYWLPNGTRWVFEHPANGGERRLRIVQPDGDTLWYSYVGTKFWSPTRQQLQVFEGAYRSDELGVAYQVQLVGDSLSFSIRPGVTQTLRPTYTDAFARGGATVWFSRDRGRVTSMHLSEGRMWNLVLPRVR